MSGREVRRRFSREFKVAALSRLAAGESVRAVADDLGVRPKCLYQWQERYRLGGEVALRSCGRMTKAERVQMLIEAAARGRVVEPRREAGGRRGGRGQRSADPPDELAVARERIAELEGKVGRQQLELDFFHRALRHVGGAQPRSGVPGGTGSTRSSKE